MRTSSFISAAFTFFFTSLAAAQAPAPSPTEPRRVPVSHRQDVPDLSFSLYPAVYLNGEQQDFAGSATTAASANQLRHMYAFGLRVGHPFTREIEAEADFFYSPTRDGGLLLYTYFAALNGVYNFNVSDRVVPYVLAGPGLLTVHREQDSIDRKFGVDYGAGVRIFLGRRFHVRPEVRGLSSFDPEFHTAFVGSLILTHYADFNGGRSADQDADGIPDSLDGCVREKETVNGYLDQDGCPDAVPAAPPVAKDTDQDGILDGADQCPTQKETANGYMDQDGCPDETPPVPKAFVSPAPDKDSDGDKILDAKDQCVNEPETYNSYKDDDGCPDTVPEELKSFTGRIDGIFFSLGSAIIERRSYRSLDQAVETFKKYPNLLVKIEGHTDSSGSKKVNARLSKERAESVRQYLASRGIDMGRILIEGFGSAKPIASNATSTGRSQNRRIEFKLTEKAAQ